MAKPADEIARRKVYMVKHSINGISATAEDWNIITRYLRAKRRRLPAGWQKNIVDGILTKKEALTYFDRNGDKYIEASDDNMFNGVNNDLTYKCITVLNKYKLYHMGTSKNCV